MRDRLKQDPGQLKSGSPHPIRPGGEETTGDNTATVSSRVDGPSGDLSGTSYSSHESSVGYGPLIREILDAYMSRVDFYRSSAGGSLSLEDAQREAFHECRSSNDVMRVIATLTKLGVKSFDLCELGPLLASTPHIAEQIWEAVKLEGRRDFESGHLAANAMFPVDYMKEAWNIARYLGIRESFIDDWRPIGGIEISLIDMLAQAFFQWQYWLEQTVLRSQTEPRREHHEYAVWKNRNDRSKRPKSWGDGYWFPPYVEEQEALEHAVQLADRWNRIYMRTLRQLRDLRRYAPVTINNANQVNIATDGGKQINCAESKK